MRGFGKRKLGVSSQLMRPIGYYHLFFSVFKNCVLAEEELLNCVKNGAPECHILCPGIV